MVIFGIYVGFLGCIPTPSTVKRPFGGLQSWDGKLSRGHWNEMHVVREGTPGSVQSAGVVTPNGWFSTEMHSKDALKIQV